MTHLWPTHYPAFPSLSLPCPRHKLQSVEEIQQEAAPRKAGGLPVLTFVMTNVATVLGLTHSPAMRLRMQPDAARGEVRQGAVVWQGASASIGGTGGRDHCKAQVCCFLPDCCRSASASCSPRAWCRAWRE